MHSTTLVHHDYILEPAAGPFRWLWSLDPADYLLYFKTKMAGNIKRWVVGWLWYDIKIRIWYFHI